jgi:hypothetical protein
VSISILIIFGIFYNNSVYAAPSVSIVDSYGYLNELGEYVVVGEVVNNGDIPVHFVEVVVTFFDKDHQQLQQFSISSALEIINPGQVSPFMVALQDTQDASFVSSYDVKVGNLAPFTPKDINLDIIFYKLETLENDIVVSGRVANDGSAISSNTRAMIVLYNAVGEPVRFVSTFTEPRNILPFASATFSARIKVDNIQNIQGYAITMESSNYAETKRIVQKTENMLERIHEVVDISRFETFDQNNRSVSRIDVNEPLLVKLNIENKMNETNDYTYILQVKNEQGFVTSLSWSMGIVPAAQGITAVIAWIPDEIGTYRLEAFVWKSMEEPVPLAFNKLTDTIRITA